MAQGSLRRYDVQAKWSVICSVLALLPVVLAVLGVVWRFDWETRVLAYRPWGMRHLGVLACTATAVLLSAIGIILGFNSAGQRRNEKQKQSWFGFFVGTAALLGAVSAIAAFLILGIKLS